jgi:hypothetical protein
MTSSSDWDERLGGESKPAPEPLIESKPAPEPLIVASKAA